MPTRFPAAAPTLGSVDTRSAGPVTADDVLEVVGAAVKSLKRGAAADWTAPAGELEWDCWETVEHLADDLFVYAAQLGARPQIRHSLPFEATARHPGGAVNTVRANPDAGVAGLLDVLSAGGAMLAAMVRVTPSAVTAFHSFGPADAEASAAMGVLETMVHTYDVATGCGVEWTPDRPLCARVLARLMPDVDATTGPDGDPWRVLLWATGRIDLPDRPRRRQWRWHNTRPGR
jgi:hypothetical protein